MLQAKGLLFAALLSTFAVADIPDRVNYEKFRDLHQTQKAVSDQARSQAEAARQTLAGKTAARQKLEADKTQLESDIRRDQASIERHKGDIRNLESQILANQNQTNANDQRIQTLSFELGTLNTQISNKESDIQRQNVLVRDAEAIRLTAQNQVTQTEQKHAEAVDKIRQSEAERDRLTLDLVGFVEAATRLRAQLDELRKDIRETQQEIQQLMPVNQANKAEVQAQTQKKTDLEKRQAELTAKQNKTPAEVAELAKIMATDLPQAEAQLAASTAKLARSSSRLKHLRNLNNIARDQLQVGMNEGLPAVDRDVQRTQLDIDGAKSRIRQFEDVAREWMSLVELRRQQFQGADADLNRQVAVRDQQIGELNTFKNNKINNEAESSRLATESASLRSRILAAQQQISSFQSAIGIFESAIARRQAQISLVETNINNASGEEFQAQQVFQNRDSLAQQEEAKTATAYSAYQSVLAQYNREKDSARSAGLKDGSAAGGREGSERGTADGRTAGDSQGDRDGYAKGEKDGRARDYKAGYQTGRTRGLDEGKSKGTADGDAAGLTAGATAGYAEGLAEGESNGNKDGYKSGYDGAYAAKNNDANRKVGYDAGVLKGTARAKDQARREDYPRGRKDSEEAILKSDPLQKIDIDNAPTVVPPPQASLWLPSRKALIGLVNWLVPDAFAAPANIPIPAASPKYTYKQYLQTYEHPDFDRAYQGAYDTTYDGSFQSQFRSTYDAAYRVAYDASHQRAYAASLAVAHPDETKKGDEKGYSDGYNVNYRPAYQTAYNAAYRRAFDEAKAKALPVNFQKGFDDGKAKGVPVGEREGTAFAVATGEASGEPVGYQDNIVAERAKAYESGKQDLTGEYQSSFRPKVISAKLIDKNADGTFEVWEKASLEVVVRNFGGRTSADGQVEVQLTDTRGNFLSSVTKAGLKALPAGALATYKNALAGTPIGGFDGVKITVSVLSGGAVVNTTTVEQKVKQDLYVVFTNSQSKVPMLIGWANAEFSNRLWIQNIGTAAVESGMKARIVGRNGFRFYQGDWNNAATYSAIAPNAWGVFSIGVSAPQIGKFDTNPVLVEIKDKDGYLIFHGDVNAAVHVGQ